MSALLHPNLIPRLNRKQFRRIPGGRRSKPMMGGFFSDAWDILTGKPQSWYTNVSNIQNQLSIVLAGVSEAGKDVWNTVSTAADGPTQDGTPASGVDDYDKASGDLTSAISSIIVTKDHVPEDSTINGAKQTAVRYQQQLDYVKSVAPEVAAQIAAYQNQVAQMLPGTMTSPSTVGKEVFVQQLEDRAKALGQGATSILMWVALGLLGIGLTQMGGRK